MSDLMLLGVLGMPLPDNPADLDVVTWAQVKDRMLQARNRIVCDAAEVVALRKENERLRTLVEEAYCEGFDYAVTLDPDCEWSGGNVWPDSRARAALQGETE